MKNIVNESKTTVDYLPSKDTLKPEAGTSAARAPTAPLVYNGGPIISAVQLISFYWGPFTSSDISQMQAWLAGYVGYLNGQGVPVGQEHVLQQYGVSGATLRTLSHRIQRARQRYRRGCP